MMQENNMNFPGKVTLLISIPCLNEAESIVKVVSAVQDTIEGVDSISVLVVDDGSTDGTADLAARAGALVLRHTHNKGVGAAFKSALDYAVENQFSLMVNMDGDGQFDPADIPRLIAPILAGNADMTTASRFVSSAYIPEMPKIKLWGNRMMSRLISFLTREKFYDVSCGFRCYSRETLLHLNLHGTFTYTQETFIDLISKNLRIIEVPTTVKYFSERQSRVAGSIFRYAVNTSKIIFCGYRDYFPIRFFWGIALFLGIPALFFALLFFGHFLLTGLFSGYLFSGFLAAFLAILSLTFFIVGIVADMLVRIRTNQEKILYNIKKSISYQNKHHRLPHTILPQIHIAENGNTLDQPQTLHSDEHAKILNLHREHYNSSNRIACYLIDNFKTTILRIINKYKICKVFDIGCGDGHISLFLAQHGYIVEGGDINEILIRQANLDVIEKNLYDNAKFNIIDIFNFDFSSIKSEIVLCSEVLEHLDNVDDAVDKIYKIQADLFLFSVPTEPLWRILNMARLKYLKNFGNTPGHVNHWGYGEFKRFLERKFVILEYIFVIPWSIALCKKK